jgi:urease accessory protein
MTATLASPMRLERTAGAGRLTALARSSSRTLLDTLYQSGAARILLPNTHDRSLQAVLMNTAGGLTGGDRLDWSVTAGADAHVVATTPAAERIYRSLGGPADVTVRLEAAAGARLDWLPQETILFDHAQLDRRIDVDLAPGAHFLAVEAVVLGRAAMGETADNAQLRDRWRIRRDGRLVHAEETRLVPGPGPRISASLLAGARAFATILYIAPDADRRSSAVRAAIEGGTTGASLVGDKLTIRALAESSLALRRKIVPILALLTESGALPRLWLS